MATIVNKIVQLPYEQAFNRLYHCIANCGYAISKADPQCGIIMFSTPVSLNDWGFNFTARVSTLGNLSSQINFHGDTKFGIDLFKFGNKKIEKMMKNY